MVENILGQEGEDDFLLYIEGSCNQRMKINPAYLPIRMFIEPRKPPMSSM